MTTLPSPEDVLDARRALAGVAVTTPVLRSERLDRLTGASVHIKCENLQRTGAFKFRGAYNCLSRLDRQAYPGGVVAYSTGNHGQAIATVGRMLGIPATVVMPSDAPAVKIAKARENGASIVLYDRSRQSREEIAAQIAARSPVAVVPPGDDRFIIAGQGTAAAEGLDQIGISDSPLILVPCGGGGLAAGTCLATEAMRSTAEVWAVEPEAFDDTRRSLASGDREVNPTLTGSLCDALLAPTPAELPFSINRERLAKVLTASDQDVLRAIRFAHDELKLVTEPGGVIALASLLCNPDLVRGRNVLVIVSGGNVDPSVFKQALDLDVNADPTGRAA
ncbi:threonine ammonia-lyase [Azospirillum brasilense]|uniref:threonine ammonia-lyase n=1 Tax=Azospirillum brasilense TaxID=192 RepID=UPI000E686CF5|nr:threonine/serine dehydratase [Azospirillum brasilense]NUB28133.1 pyridoxal-phosphate dependent enzyme [Azospirillum brasilense]NUB33240.1 pyridoxal-phosphate dependent enzyme [Azospirillum brasilense]RIW00151.1 threonine/serine dehydratase [Azospirillum brasilense]